MKIFAGGTWIDREEKIEVTNPYDGSLVDTVPKATADDVEAALAAAVEGAKQMRSMPARDRWEILEKTARLMEQRKEALGRTISLEAGKLLREGLAEVSRAIETIRLSAEEAKRICGEVLPLDAAPGGQCKLGFTLRVPCGVVVAITPFNFPLNLVCHKVGPALAAGNAVIVKPASDTPLSALQLVDMLLESGLPPQAIACLTGSGSDVGAALTSDSRVRKISFTGSAEVGRKITGSAGLKKVTLELGANCPLIVMPDADMEKVVEAAVATGFANAGQTCISAQRVIVLREVYDELIERLRPKIEEIRAGDPLDESSDMGPLIRQHDAQRVHQWLQEAVQQGARLVCGGRHRSTLYQPSLLVDVQPDMRVSRDELFGPAVCLTPAADIEEAIGLANDSTYGLSAGVFTQDIDGAIRFAREVDSGNIHINWGPGWRADLMPYGGLKGSGMGKEGPKYAVQEMTETKMIIVHTP